MVAELKEGREMRKLFFICKHTAADENSYP